MARPTQAWGREKTRCTAHPGPVRSFDPRGMPQCNIPLAVIERRIGNDPSDAKADIWQREGNHRADACDGRQLPLRRLIAWHARCQLVTNDGIRSCRQQRWHLGGVQVKINGVTHCLWRAVDHAGEVLECSVTKMRGRDIALTPLRKSMRRHGHRQTIGTKRLRPHDAAVAEQPDQNPHLQFRRRDLTMLRSRCMRTFQRFACIHASAHDPVPSGRHH